MMTPEERARTLVDPISFTDEVRTHAIAIIGAAIGEAVAEEREACALIADSQDSAACEYIAEQIRARGKP